MKQTKAHAQNSIDYIVYSNPSKVATLLENFGYEAPKNSHDLVKATKLLIQKEGKKVIAQLLEIHPDKAAILKINQSAKEDLFCGVCSSYSYLPEMNLCKGCGHSYYDGSDKTQFLEQLEGKSTKELEKYYEKVIKKFNRNPDNSNLAEEVELVWQELKRKKTAEKQGTDIEQKIEASINANTKKNSKGELSSQILILGLTFIGGVLVGNALKPVFVNG